MKQDISIEDLDGVIEVIVNDPDFESSEKGLETYDSIEELKYPTRI